MIGARGINFVLLSVFVLIFSRVHGQDRPSGPGTGRPGFDAPKIGIISGIVLDDSTSAPLPFVSVGVFRLPDSVAAGGGLTDEKGRFKIQELTPGNYFLRANSVGYRSRTVAAGRINPEKFHLSGLEIRMRSSVTRLKEIKIEAEAPEYVNSIDKKVYSVGKNIVNMGGTVTDVLQQIPSVQVDMDGKVALRGSENVTILIDGKPSGMLGNDRRAVLQQIPAAVVDEIEVVTNPSAKYDAEGMAGIINIKTKRDKFQGTNGTANTGIGTNEKYNAGLSMNDRTMHRNLYFNYNYRHERRNNTAEGEQYNYSGERYSWENNSFGTNTTDGHNAKAGMDLYFGPRNTLGLNAGFSDRKEVKPDQVSYSFYDSTGTLYDPLSIHPSFTKVNRSDERNTNFDAGVDFKHTWSANKGEFTASASGSGNNRRDDGLFSNSLFDQQEVPYQKSHNGGRFRTVIAQADLSWPFRKFPGKLDAGFKNTSRKVSSEQDLGYYSSVTGTYVDDARFGDVLDFSEQVSAAYAMYSGKYGKFEYNAGLRIENTSVGIDSRQAGTYSNDYLKLFPSTFLKYVINSKREVQLSYSRRINRADSRQLNPFTDYSDSINIRRGNPYLNPELTNSFDLSFARNYEGGSFTASVYFRHTDDLISRFRNYDPVTEINTMTFINYSSSENLGVEATTRLAIVKSLTVMGSVNFFRNTINGENVSAELQSEANQFNGRVNVNARLTTTTTFQLTANYMSPMKSPVGEFRGMSGVDAGVRQDLWKGKGSLNLNVTDIFRTRVMNVHNFIEGQYDYRGERYRESRIGMLTLQYRFGSNDTNQRRKSRQEQRPSNEMMDSPMDF
jgi:outer membrane receptor protein involved in Fe transport